MSSVAQRAAAFDDPDNYDEGEHHTASASNDFLKNLLTTGTASERGQARAILMHREKAATDGQLNAIRQQLHSALAPPLFTGATPATPFRIATLVAFELDSHEVFYRLDGEDGHLWRHYTRALLQQWFSEHPTDALTDELRAAIHSLANDNQTSYTDAELAQKCADPYNEQAERDYAAYAAAQKERAADAHVRVMPPSVLRVSERKLDGSESDVASVASPPSDMSIAGASVARSEPLSAIAALERLVPAAESNATGIAEEIVERAGFVNNNNNNNNEQQQQIAAMEQRALQMQQHVVAMQQQMQQHVTAMQQMQQQQQQAQQQAQQQQQQQPAVIPAPILAQVLAAAAAAQQQQQQRPLNFGPLLPPLPPPPPVAAASSPPASFQTTYGEAKEFLTKRFESTIITPKQREIDSLRAENMRLSGVFHPNDPRRQEIIDFINAKFSKPGGPKMFDKRRDKTLALRNGTQQQQQHTRAPHARSCDLRSHFFFSVVSLLFRLGHEGEPSPRPSR